MAVLGGVVASGMAPVHAQPTLTGTVVQDDSERALAGAEVLLRETDAPEVVRETTTGPGGTFRFPNVLPGRYTLAVQQLGYAAHRRALVVEVGESRDLTVRLERDPASFESVVRLPLRRPAQVRSVPTAVSVVEPERIRREGISSSVEALRSAPGVDVAQTGVDRRLLSMHGVGGPFADTPYALVDGRSAAAPLLGTNAFGAMPLPSLDLQRIEAVPGPSTSLYGPEASGGVTQFFTRDPFQDPGTALSVAGGSRSFVDAQFRQAGVVGERVGYKFTGQYSQANEWGLDPDDPQDASEISRYYTYGPDESIPSDRHTIDRQLRREDQYRTYNASGLLSYRMGPETTLSLRGGYASLTSPLQTGLGTIQADALNYGYGQLQLESGSFEAQVGLNRNLPQGDAYLLRTGEPVVQEGTKWTGSAQYGAQLEILETHLLVGGDLDVIRPGGSTSTLAQQQGDDGIGRYGVFAQTTSALASRLSVTLGARLDYNDVVEDASVAPRAAFVFDLAPQHTLRASYTGAVSHPGTDPLFAAGRFSVDPTVRTTAHTVEMGYKGAMAEGVQLQVDAYYEEKTNVLTAERIYYAYPAIVPFPEPQPPELDYDVADHIRYGGLDVSLRVQATDRTTAFANVSAVTNNEFAVGSDAPVALNGPSFTASGGLDVAVAPGLSVGATAQYVEGFPVRWGPYLGSVDSYARLDLRLGYDVPLVQGLQVDVSAKNVLGGEHREFAGAPELGRMIIGRLTYELP